MLISVPLYAQQNSLERVSAVTRSDGNGFVVRYHLDEPVDSHRVYQPTPDLVQMTLYSSKIDTTEIEMMAENEQYDEIRFYDIPFGIGVDIYLGESEYYKAKAYPDGSSDDLLLGLTKTTEEEITYLTEGLEPIIWSRLYPEYDDMIAGTNGNDYAENGDENYNHVKDKMKFDLVVIDAGHGGHDVGSIGYKGVYEKDIVLNIAKKAGNYIEERIPGVKVVYTREDDRFIDLEERGSIANRAEGDLFISTHTNAFSDHRPYGTEVYFLGLEKSNTALEVMKRENNIMGTEEYDTDEILSPEKLLAYELQNSGYIATSEKIAGMIDHQFEERAQRRSRGVKQARFVVLYHASMPAVLVEAGFISNPSEQRFLSSDWGQDIIASAIYRAVKNFKKNRENKEDFNTN